MSNINRSHQIGQMVLLVLTAMCMTIAPAAAQPPEPTPPPEPAPPSVESRPKGYIGVGAAFGLGGSSTALATGGLTIFSKKPLSDNLSIHNTNVVFGSSIPSSAIDLTLDLPIRDSDTGKILYSPFIGAGAMLRNENGSIYVSPHLTAGVDLPMLDFTPTIRVSVGFPNDRPADIGLILGVGTSF
jgi:hypothetical protein